MDRFSVLALGNKCRGLVNPVVEMVGLWQGGKYAYTVTLRGEAKVVPSVGLFFQAVSIDAVPDSSLWVEGDKRNAVPLEAGNTWWEVPMESIPLSAVVWQVCDPDGKARVFRDAGAAVEKVRRVLDVEEFSVQFAFVGSRGISLPADMAAAATKRQTALNKLMQAAEARDVQIGMALSAMVGFGSETGAKRERYDEMKLRQKAVSADIAEIDRQLANMPYIETTPDS